MSTYQPYPPTQNPNPGYAPLPQAPMYPPVPYPQQMGGRPPHPQETAVLVLGILGIVVAGILGPIAWYMGNKALRECASGMYIATDQLKVGRILGIVGTILLIIAVVAVIGILIFWLIFINAVVTGY